LAKIHFLSDGANLFEMNMLKHIQAESKG